MDEKTAPLYAQTNAYKWRVEKTKRFIAESLAKVNSPYVACSFGKDSSVMLHLVLEQKPDVQVKCLGKKETHLIDDYAGIFQWWESNFGIQVEFIEYTGWLEDSKAKTGISENVTDSENDSFFVGLRMEESFARRVSLKKYGMFHVLKNGKTRIAPLCAWKTNDIAAYMLTNNLPILKAYQREGFSARTTTNIPSKYPHEALARLKDQDVTAYNELLKMLPDAKYFS
jgi:3'-phosphoadenosine 5'-phosphosulfate sulfotransferase (PAPS reductase)/FAD synthetase